MFQFAICIIIPRIPTCIVQHSHQNRPNHLLPGEEEPPDKKLNSPLQFIDTAISGGEEEEDVEKTTTPTRRKRAYKELSRLLFPLCLTPCPVGSRFGQSHSLGRHSKFVQIHSDMKDSLISLTQILGPPSVPSAADDDSSHYFIPPLYICSSWSSGYVYFR